MNLIAITNRLRNELSSMSFDSSVPYVYNPLAYARQPYERYLRAYGRPPKEVVLVGMNPGPWGMAQTGVPFGDLPMVRDWLGIEGKVEQPGRSHPKRPVEGFSCRRGEVSGRRLWGWARDRFSTPEDFFTRFFVANYCPLAFFAEEGTNVTPDKLRSADRAQLFTACDRALAATIEYLRPRFVVGVGAFAEKRILATDHGDVSTGRITHPSPANPRARHNWAGMIEKELRTLGVRF